MIDLVSHVPASNVFGPRSPIMMGKACAPLLRVLGKQLVRSYMPSVIDRSPIHRPAKVMAEMSFPRTIVTLPRFWMGS